MAIVGQRIVVSPLPNHQASGTWRELNSLCLVSAPNTNYPTAQKCFVHESFGRLAQGVEPGFPEPPMFHGRFFVLSMYGIYRTNTAFCAQDWPCLPVFAVCTDCSRIP